MLPPHLLCLPVLLLSTCSCHFEERSFEPAGHMRGGLRPPPSCNLSIKALFSFQQFAWKTNAKISITPNIKKCLIRRLKFLLAPPLPAITFTPSSNASQVLACISITPALAWSLVRLEVARILWRHSVRFSPELRTQISNKRLCYVNSLPRNSHWLSACCLQKKKNP